MIEEKLPKGWDVYPLIKLLELLETGSRPKGGVQGIIDGIPSLGGEHLDYNGGFKFDKLKFIPLEFAEKMKRGRIYDGDVLIVKDGATTGKTSFVDDNFPFDEAYVNEHVFICRPNKNHSGKFISFFLRSKEGQKRILENFTGSAQGGINQKFAQNTQVPIPPLPEQQRIVAKLDAMFGHLDSLREKMDGIPVLLKNFRQQVLTQAVTGELTKEWREGKGLGEWEEKNLEEICISITDGDHQAPPKAESGIPFLVISDISNGNLDLEKASRFVPIQYFENLKESRKPQKNDILYTVTGSIGIPVLLKKDYEFTFQRHIGIIRPSVEQINEKFLYYTLMSEYCLTQGRSVATGTAQLTIPLSGLRKYNIPLPVKEEQLEIIKKIDTLFSLADKIESKYTSLKAKIDQLPQAILAKAFRGDLVSQQEDQLYQIEEAVELMAAEKAELYKLK
ncbi:restriction endonuclease subunit S [Litoribacter alkaliphilus]|uniref:Restriction endonuclease subunit S n=1 Tax=Litoribacter ruber TaxID=702568 RepID=A0AAP2G6G2_9BACT|nr:restriction endonuclease subunit S [Litoribacter alkaliphilus]MBS9525668.1 restriction endonuclease subunit S [Litoribacter alkaliphilus]